ncbi:MAG: GWxTD domain-containing protein [bacterium]|nr:GWxTD domain-containing protein [bacterium]
MMIRMLFLWTSLLATGGSVWSQDSGVLMARDLPLRMEGTLEMFVETASFRGPEGTSRLEVYSLLDARQLQFVPEAGKFVSQIDFTATLFDSAGVEAKRQFWTRNVSVESLQNLKQNGALVRDIVSFDLVPGQYKLRLSVEDIYGDLSGQCEGLSQVGNFDPGYLKLSDILFSSEVERAIEPDRFVKNGLRVVPNTTRFFRVGQPIQVYYEIYNLKLVKDNPNDSFVLGYALVDTGDVVVKTYPAKRLQKPGESVVKSESLSTEGLVGGVYFLQVEVFDRGTREHLRHRRRVFLVSGEDDAPQLSEEEEEQMRYFKDIRHVASEKELAEFEKLDGKAQMSFLKSFWSNLDPTPGTPLNERLRDHLIWTRYADQNFTSVPGKSGSSTDKGRVYIRYGPPSERDFQTSAAAGKAVDMWIYEKSGRYVFVFVDLRGTGIYELVHSTMSGELYNPNWRDTIF